MALAAGGTSDRHLAVVHAKIHGASERRLWPMTRPPCHANGRQLTDHKQAFGGSAPSMTGVER